jgi:parvulin-like peptidyl-prolyl isomerase
MPQNDIVNRSGIPPKIPGIKAKRKKTSGRRQIILISSILAVLVILVTGAFYYQYNIAPFRSVVLTVDNNVIRMDYYLKRAKMLGTDTSSVLQQLVDEEIIKLDAPKMGIQISDEEIDIAMHQGAASALSEESSLDTAITTTTTSTASITDDEFNKWYNQQLEQTRLSSSEYREMMRIRLLALKVQEYLNSAIPASAEQVHLHVILVDTLSDANNAKARITSGESFADVAKSVSQDSSASNGGDLGWVPKGAYGYESTTFSLSIGQVSEPLPLDSANPDTSRYLIFMVSEKAADRTVDESSIQLLQSNYMSGWLYQQMSEHNIQVKYNFNDTSKASWVTLQLAKMDVAETTTKTTSASTTKPVTSTGNKVDYSFGIYEDEQCTKPITESSVIDFGPVEQGTIIARAIYIKNLGIESSDPVIFAGMNTGSDMAMVADQVTLTGDSVETAKMALGAVTKATTGVRTFTIMISRGTMTGGYTIFVQGKATVTPAPATTKTTTTGTVQTTETTTTSETTASNP